MIAATTTGQAWGLLLVAGLLEIVWALGLKYSDGFTRWVPSVVVVIGAALSFCSRPGGMRALPAAPAYAVWTGIGAAGTAILGIVLLGEPATLLRLGCVGLIVAGVLGLKMVS